jgi:dihydroorotate dehydrogenase
MNADIINYLYKHALKPVLFAFEPENVHDMFTLVAKVLGKNKILQKVTELTFDYKNPILEKEVLGIKFRNPVGLSAGYDYNGLFLNIMPQTGFGFSTVGTVTNIPTPGNGRPAYTRLIKSRSILVNKGFRNDGAEVIAKRLNSNPENANITFGVSIGSSNVPEINTPEAAIKDYIECFKKMEESKYHKFYELNISCPNIGLAEIFNEKEYFSKLAEAVKDLNISRPIFLKVSNELEPNNVDALIETAMKNGIKAFIFSNLIKNRNNEKLDKEEVASVVNLKGSFSGKPTEEGSNRLIKYAREKFGKDIVIVGTGGIFSGEDAQKKFDAGADLVQLITGMIFEGPQLIGQINKHLAEKLMVK